MGYPVERVPKAPTSVDTAVLDIELKAYFPPRSGRIALLAAPQEFPEMSGAALC